MDLAKQQSELDTSVPAVGHGNADQAAAAPLDCREARHAGCQASDPGCHTAQLKHPVADQQELVVRSRTGPIESEKLAVVSRMVTCLINEIDAPIGLGLNAANYLGKVADEIGASYRDGLMKRSNFEDFLAATMDCAQLLSRNLRRAADLLSNLRGVSAGGDEQRRQLRLREFLSDVLLNLQPRLRERHISARLLCAVDLEVYAEPGTLYRIVSNLVTNAIQHAFKGMLLGEISIRAVRQDDHVRLEFVDNGVGIEPDHQRQIFEPFFTTSRESGCLGLGLHVVHCLVTRNLAGTIDFASRRGQGTAFTISFPAGKGSDDGARDELEQ